MNREVLEVDVLVVGAGPSGLAFAIKLSDLISDSRQKGTLKGAAASPDFMMMVLEKGAEVGDHILSGAVLDPKGLDELMPYWRESAPVGPAVEEEALYYLTPSGKFKFPWVPPDMHNRGCFLVSLSQLVKWMGQVAEAKGVEIMTSTAAVKPVIEDGVLRGVITDDKGLDKEGNPKPNYQPGVEIRAKMVVVAEGPRGSLAKNLISQLQLDRGRNPQSYVTGVKELWEVPHSPPAGTVWHTLGFPHPSHTFGGGWVYVMGEGLISLGLVTALASPDPGNDPHHYFQIFKTHPLISSLLKGGKMVKYGAKTIAEGGFWAMPQLYHHHLLLLGESAGFLNARRLKGIHLGIKSGILAAEVAFAALSEEDYSEKSLGRYEEKFKASWAYEELWRVRNFHQPYSKGLWWGLAHTALQIVTGGKGLYSRYSSRPDHLHYLPIKKSPYLKIPLKIDGSLTFDKLTDVYASGTRHEENQPTHLLVSDPSICTDRCTEEFGNPCQYFCPASVYEMVPREDGKLRLQINASNCVHCKTCDIADPYGIITWVPPEGGGGPRYLGL